MMNTILTHLDRIADDADYYVIKSKNEIHLTIEDFAGFDENWIEIDREYVNPEAIAETLAWLRDNASFISDDFYTRYQIGNVVVVLGYSSYDI